MPSAKIFQAAASAAHPHIGEGARDRLRAVEAAHAPAWSLRRTGLRPYAFNGTLVATVSGVTPALPFWYEINLYDSVLGTVVTDVRLFRNDEGLADRFQVAEHDELEAAFAHLERYDPGADLPVPCELASASGVTLALGAARLQLAAEEIRGHYASVVGELLQGLQPRSA